MTCKQSHTPRINKMCKDKWNYIHGDYKRILDYHTSIGNNTSHWDLTFKEWDIFHLPKQYNENYYNAIEAFQGEKGINVPIHVKDLQAEGDESMHCREKKRKKISLRNQYLISNARVTC